MPIAVLWFDTPSDMNPERAAKFLPLLANWLGWDPDTTLPVDPQGIP